MNKDLIPITSELLPPLPTSFRCLIVGPSNCGKTYLLKNMLLPNCEYDNCFIVGPTNDQYDYDENTQSVQSDELFKPSELDKNERNLMIFDDVMLEKKPVFGEYFCRGRHNNCNMFYISQDFHEVPRRTIRRNCNLFILFKQDNKSLRHIYDDFFDDDEFSFTEFKNICKLAWMTKYSYIVIDLDSEYLKLRENWNKVWFK